MEINTADVVLCGFYFDDLKTTKNRPVLVLKNNLPYQALSAFQSAAKLNIYSERSNFRFFE